MSCRLSRSYLSAGSSACFVAWLLLLCLSVSAHAQTQRDFALEEVPPPLRYIPNDLRDQLNIKTDLKARTKLVLLLADERLKRAELLTAERRFGDASAELGIYQALVEESVRYLHAAQRRNGDLRDQYRKLEVAFRSYRTRLELLSRSTSSSYRVHLLQISDDTWRIRTQVLNRFFGDEVIDDDQTGAPDRPSSDGQSRPLGAHNRTAPDDRK